MRKALFYILFILPFVVSLFFWETLKDPLVLREWASKQSFFVLMLLPVAQTVFLPCYNFAVNLAYGYIFGPWWGFVYSYFGWLGGAAVAYLYWRLISQLGKVNLSSERLEALRVEMKDAWLLIALGGLLPMTPDDVLVIVIAITNIMSFRYFVLDFAVGTLPGKLATCYLGDAIAELWSVVFYHTSWSDRSTIGAIVMFLYLFFCAVIAYAEREHFGRLKRICTGKYK